MQADGRGITQQKCTERERMSVGDKLYKHKI